MHEIMYHLGSEVAYSPNDESLKAFAGKAEIVGINSRGEQEVYLILTKNGGHRISANLEELKLPAKARVSRSS